MTTFTITLRTKAGISKTKLVARDIAQARALAAIQYGCAVLQITIVP
ncbi:hypothetical protein [Novosphingobium sp. PhB57]|nr:hypothetical protein [Novosphingobium sp. PhB57]